MFKKVAWMKELSGECHFKCVSLYLRPTTDSFFAMQQNNLLKPLVMKFGGASVGTADAVRNVARIIRLHLSDQRPLLVVISAMAKTTNHLERLAYAARDAQEAETWEKLDQIRAFHYEIIGELFGAQKGEVTQKVDGYFTEVERICKGILLLNEFPQRTYDRIVAYGELISTTIVEHFLQQEGVRGAWIDVREIIKTDASYTQAQVIWTLTRENIATYVRPVLEDRGLVVTQGFIASSMEGKVTTLGREGSDYTASIFAHCLEAESLTVWKDVRGILNGDPRIEKETTKHEDLSYEEAVEMTFYGATVIHPKTIKPLYNSGIPLYVKCFQDLEETGTKIGSREEIHREEEICSKIQKKNQALVHIRPRDFSFMDERLLNRIFGNVAKAGLNVNLVQTSAISLILCADDNTVSLGEFESLLMDKFFVSKESGLTLKTYLNFGVSEIRASAGAKLIQMAENKLFVVA